MRPLSTDMPPTATRQLAVSTLDVPASEVRRGALPGDLDTLAARIATSDDREEIAAAVATLARSLSESVDTAASLVVLQRTFGRLHARAEAS